MGDHITQKDHLHELTGIGQRHVGGSKEPENRFQEDQTDHHEQETNNQVQCHGIAQQMFGRLIVPLSEFHTDTCRRSDTDGCTKGSRQVHEGESDAQTGDGLRTNHLSDKCTVNDIIKA